MRTKFKIYSLLLLQIILLFPQMKGWACEVCEANQPKALKGLVHGPGPQHDWDYYIIAFALVIVGITLFLSVKYLVRPQEQNHQHIKYSVLQNKKG